MEECKWHNCWRCHKYSYIVKRYFCYVRPPMKHSEYAHVTGRSKQLLTFPSDLIASPSPPVLAYARPGPDRCPAAVSASVGSLWPAGPRTSPPTPAGPRTTVSTPDGARANRSYSTASPVVVRGKRPTRTRWERTKWTAVACWHQVCSHAQPCHSLSPTARTERWYSSPRRL